jgi:hypothetical protein
MLFDPVFCQGRNEQNDQNRNDDQNQEQQPDNDPDLPVLDFDSSAREVPLSFFLPEKGLRFLKERTLL